MARLSHKKENMKNNKRPIKQPGGEASSFKEKRTGEAPKEKGPTKRQLREELKVEEKLKTIKNRQKKGKITPEEAQKKKEKLMANGKAKKENDAISEQEKGFVQASKSSNLNKKELKNEGSGLRKRSSKNLQLKRKNDEKLREGNSGIPDKKVKKQLKKKRSNKTKDGKIFYTRENINSFLIEARDKSLKDKAVTMIMFLFKMFKKNSPELLAKIKILTSNKKVDTEGLSIHAAIIKHLFVFFEMKSDFFENLFGLVSTDSLLSKYACSYLYSQKFDNEEYDEHFHKICSELARVLEKTASLPLDDYLEYVNEIDLMENPDDFRFEEYEETHDNDECCADSNKAIEQKSNNFVEAQNMLCEPEENDDTFSLKSLNDDDEIRRIDAELGKYFGKDSLSFKEVGYVFSLSKYFEAFLKANYATNIDHLKTILYFYQFDPISVTFKHIIKKFVSKFNDPKRLFRIFHSCCIVNPSLYSLYRVFLSACNSDFQHLSFLKSAFNFGHEDFLVNKIIKESFYDVYTPNLGKEFDDFMKSLVLLENRREKLIELSQRVYSPEIQEEISKAINRAEDKKDAPLDNDAN